MSSNEPLIRAENLKKHYQNESDFIDRLLGRQQWVKAVDGISLEIEEGETLGLVGESGCGKSTVGRTLLQLHEPTDGTVYFKGEDITEYSSNELRELRQEMQLIFQNPQSSLNPRLTVNDIIGEALDIHGLEEGQSRDERIKELLELVGLSASHANRYPHEFSGGQLQRIGIARALAVEPDFIVCDEPVSALDVSVQAQILNLLKDLQEEFGITYLFIAHDLSVVEHIADRIAVMYLGEIVEVGTPEELFAPPQHPYTEALLSAVPEPDPGWNPERIILEGTVPSPLDPPSGCKFHTRCPKVIPPADLEFEQEEWRAVRSFATRVESGDLPLGSLREEYDVSDASEFDEAIREEHDIPARLSDPEAEEILSETIQALEQGSFERANDAIGDAFETPCTVHEPELQQVEGTEIACHLYDSRYQDGSVDESAASGQPTAAVSESDD
ncbi:ATP-binding cassette domain-containing protein [Halovenus sp. WSH3]|uniref:ATP-binding cassette domain-containing protein n=1 Tax=Halovenus carboxidivorans TaxID=2692199 RepID=A0A6B0T1V9_9EURY|nr:ABC transporter ATP-binding protein [Halovenus carboxidivorans]MXR52198.1 ATP-binding cassette domain-containing protein [Halovenus carboxidivorans]